MKLTQKLVYIGSLILAAINFLYTLAFSTNWARGAARLGQFFVTAQEVNHLIFRLALFGVVSIGLAFVFSTHKNRKFYPANYLFSILSAIMFLVIGVVTLIKVIPLKAEYLLLDPDQLRFVTLLNWSEPGVEIFNWGVGIAITMIIAALLISFITWHKFNTYYLRARIEQKRLEVNHVNS